MQQLTLTLALSTEHEMVASAEACGTAPIFLSVAPRGSSARKCTKPGLSGPYLCPTGASSAAAEGSSAGTVHVEHAVLLAKTATTLGGVPVVPTEVRQPDGTVISLPSLPGLGKSPADSCPDLSAAVSASADMETAGEDCDSGGALPQRSRTTFKADKDAGRPGSISKAELTLEGWVLSRLKSILQVDSSLRTFSMRRVDRLEKATSRRSCCGSEDEPQTEGKAPSAKQLLEYSYVKTIKRLASRNSNKMIHDAASLAEEYMAETCELKPLEAKSDFSIARKQRASTGGVQDASLPSRSLAGNNRPQRMRAQSMA